MYLPISPECHDVPQAVMITRLTRLTLLVGHLEAVDAHVAGFFQQVAAHGVLDAVGLLEDLLEHEVLEPAALDGGEVPVDLVDRLVDVARA